MTRVLKTTRAELIEVSQRWHDLPNRKAFKARLIHDSLVAHATNLILRMLQMGIARFEPSTNEFCFNGLRYSTEDGDWRKLIAVIGWDKACAAVAEAKGK